MARRVRDLHVLKAIEDVGFVRDQLVDGGPSKGGALRSLVLDADNAALELELIFQEFPDLKVLSFLFEVILEASLDRLPVPWGSSKQARMASTSARRTMTQQHSGTTVRTRQHGTRRCGVPACCAVFSVPPPATRIATHLSSTFCCNTESGYWGTCFNVSNTMSSSVCSVATEIGLVGPAAAVSVAAAMLPR